MSLFLSPSLSPSLSFSLFLSLSLSFSLFHSPFPSLSLSLSLFLSTASFTASYIPYTPYTRWWRHRSGQILPRFPARYIFSVCVDDAMGFLVLFKLRFLTTPPYPTPPPHLLFSIHTSMKRHLCIWNGRFFCGADIVDIRLTLKRDAASVIPGRFFRSVPSESGSWWIRAILPLN